MYPNEVFVGLGGNIGDSYAILCQALQRIATVPEIKDLVVSRFYCTTPVSSIPQEPYINAVCRFNTTLSARQLLNQLQEIEKQLGKKEKLKEAPRVIDLDILFFGLEKVEEPDLQIPHPRWSERLFVLAPLADLVHAISFPDSQGMLTHVNLKNYIENFPNIHQETVICIPYDLKNSPLAKNNL